MNIARTMLNMIKILSLLKSKGETTILTSEGFIVSGKDIIFDNVNKLIKSEKNSIITDLEGNNIFLEKFEYSTKIIFSNQLAT